MSITDPQLRDAAEAVRGLDNLVRRAAAAGLPAANAREVPEFTRAMDDDFATPEAVATIFSLAKDANAAIDAGNREEAAVFVATVRALAGVLGLDIGSDIDPQLLREQGDWIEQQIEARQEARARKDWAEADRIRDALRQRGIELEDTPNGTVWRAANG